MNISPISAVVAVLQAEVADLMARDLNMLGEIVGEPSAVTPVAPQATGTQATATQATAASQATAATPAEAPTPNAPDSPAANPVAQAVTLARADAAGRQAGLAPLMADLAQVEESPALPAAVRAAIGPGAEPADAARRSPDRP